MNDITMQQPEPALSPIATAFAGQFAGGPSGAIASLGFDIADYEDVSSGSVTIKDPLTGAPTPLVIELAGPEHPLRRRDAMNRARRIRNDIMRNGKVQLDDPEEQEQDDTEKLAAYTLGWSGLTSGGQPVPFSKAAALQLYADPRRRWLRDQVRAALDERERFIKRSAAA